MCWVSKTIPEKLIADKDIEVFKVVARKNLFSSELISIYTNFLYKLGEIYYQKKELCYRFNITKSYTIDEGFHSYSSNKVEVKIRKWTEFASLHIMSINFKIPLDRLFYSAYCKRMNCIIPKGSTYYINEFGEVVSDCIKPISIEDICVG